jgi:hypothetical protein
MASTAPAPWVIEVDSGCFLQGCERLLRLLRRGVFFQQNALSYPVRPRPGGVLVEPVFTAEIEYRDITSEGLLRASSFKGLSKGLSKPIK